jgi:prevent-host-death family protein
MYNRVMTEILPLAEARNRLSELATTVETTHERVIVTRNGRPVLALVALGDIEALEETLDLLSDPEAMADIHRSAAEIEAGRLIPATREQTLAWLHDEA